MRKAGNLPPTCAVVTKSGNRNFLEPSGPLRVCNGTALPLYTQNEFLCVQPFLRPVNCSFSRKTVIASVRELLRLERNIFRMCEAWLGCGGQ